MNKNWVRSRGINKAGLNKSGGKKVDESVAAVTGDMIFGREQIGSQGPLLNAVLSLMSCVPFAKPAPLSVTWVSYLPGLL